MTGGAMKNLIEEIKYPFNDSISGQLNTLRAYGRTTPQGDAVYAYMPIGSEFIVLTVDGNGAVTSADKYLKVATGANGWAKAAFGKTSSIASMSCAWNCRDCVSAAKIFRS